MAPRAWGLQGADPAFLLGSLTRLFKCGRPGPRPCARCFCGMLGEASASWSVLQAPALAVSQGREFYSLSMEGSQPGPCLSSCPALPALLPAPAPRVDVQQELVRIIFPFFIGSVGRPSRTVGRQGLRWCTGRPQSPDIAAEGL